MPSLSEAARRALGGLARASAGAAVRGDAAWAPADPGLAETGVAGGGCFVTLRTGGRLRGCLGCFASPEPLWRTVADYARHSVLDDPRFGADRLCPAEWPRVEIEVSVLSPLSPCADPLSIRLGVHGIQVSAGGRTGCFLPQVATETGWSVEEFWSHCCRDKAGLPPDAWRDGTAACLVFTAEAWIAES